MSDIKLSTAIREGAKLHPQAMGTFYDDGKTCVLGALAAIAGYDFTDYKWMQQCDEVEKLITNTYADIRNEWEHCPVVECETTPEQLDETYWDGDKLYGLVAHLNDQHKWTREAIASWLESIGY